MGQALAAIFFDGFPGLRAEAGSRPGGRGTCSLLRQRKVPKRKATPSLRPLRVATGQPAARRLRGAPCNSLRCFAASFRQPRRVSSRCMGAATPMLTPQPSRRRRSQQGLGARTGRRFARPRLAGASASRCDGPNGCWAGSLQDAPRSAAASGSGLAIV